MKKSISIVILLSLVISLTACGGNKNETVNTEATKKPAATQKAQEKETEKENTTNQVDDPDLAYLSRKYNDPDYNTDINGPNIRSFFESSSQVWTKDSCYFVIFGMYKDYWKEFVNRDAIKTVEDIVPNLKQQIILSSHAESYTSIDDVVVTSQKRVTINGIETNRFEGYFDCESDDGTVKNRYIVGYTFFYNDAPVYLLGSVSDNKQRQEYIDEVTKTVDDMIKTFREGK
ncbi:MAG: hypothetical protein BWY74_03174 [Firmicutes bacterium ADurb.Bin419]|mgnify:CR=1 FL=1|nr:MAG: hypothetical protein BWY74_03174 [Firmicutes bacterium ADurb.Bin419]